METTMASSPPPQPTASDSTNSSSRHQAAGRLVRVVPLAMDQLEGHQQQQPSTSMDEDEVRRLAVKKVQRWKRRLEESGEEHEAPATAATRPEVCNCIALVTKDRSLRVNLRRPDLEAGAELAVDSPTLRYLRTGYRNYTENSSEDVHKLTAYNCRSPGMKLYTAYKSIFCHKDPSVAFITSRGATQEQLTGAINQYFSLFSTLADFNYTMLKTTLNGSLCNVFVVDKLWSYNVERKLYVPHYRLLSGDGFTDLLVSEIRKSTNRGSHIRYLRILSSTDTVLYSNRRALFDYNDSEEADEQYARRKHRRAVGPPGESSPRLPSANPRAMMALRMDDWPGDQHAVGCGRKDESSPATGANHSTTATDTTVQDLSEPTGDVTDAKNPTLVVVKFNLDECHPDTLIYSIVCEVHLSDRIHY